MKPPFSLALVTGASSGIGRALCYLLADQGIPLIISGRNVDHLKQIAQDLQSKVQVTYIAADLLHADDRAKLIQVLRERSPDLVINNAGFGLYGNALSHSIQSQEEILEINAVVPLEITLEAAHSLKANHKPGVILNLASVAAFFIFPGLAVYSAAKSFLVNVSEALDFEMQPHQIRVLVSCPGMVATDFARRAAKGMPQNIPWGSMTAEFAARQIWKQIKKRKKRHVFDWKSRWGARIAMILPTTWLSPILKRNIQKRM